MLVVLDRDGARAPDRACRRSRAAPDRIAARLRELEEAGADEAILVVSPITERSIRQLAEVVALM